MVSRRRISKPRPKPPRHEVLNEELRANKPGTHKDSRHKRSVKAKLEKELTEELKNG